MNFITEVFGYKTGAFGCTTEIFGYTTESLNTTFYFVLFIFSARLFPLYSQVLAFI